MRHLSTPETMPTRRLVAADTVHIAPLFTPALTRRASRPRQRDDRIDDCPADYPDLMSPSDWTRLTEARGARHRLAIVGGHIIRRPFLILALAGLAFLITRFGKDFPVLYGMAPAGAVLILGSMGLYRPAGPTAENGEESSPQDTEAN